MTRSIEITDIKANTFKKGDKINILRKDITALAHRKNRTGVVSSVNGDLVMVRPSYCKWEIELYPNEIEHRDNTMVVDVTLKYNTPIRLITLKTTVNLTDEAKADII